MAITNRNFKGGEKLSAKYKGRAHTALVVKTKDGMRFRIDGKEAEFTSLSAAGVAITGSAVNGWKFFSLASEAPAPKTKKTSGKKTAPKTAPAAPPTEGMARIEASRTPRKPLKKTSA